MTNQPELEDVDLSWYAPEIVESCREFGKALEHADRACRQETGHALSPTWRALQFTRHLQDVHAEWVRQHA